VFWLKDRHHRHKMTARRDGPAVRLDEMSKRIIEQLQEDGRRSYAAIADAVGLSEAAVRQRVHKLREAGVMQIVAVTDPLMLGFRRQAMIGITAEGDLEAIAARLSALPQIEYVVICAGSFDIIIELVCEDDEQLISIVNGKVRAIEGVRSTETFMYLRLAKQTYAWGAK
jgi:Lrp/AsnC family transcriptional regulator for asnA, asnC and gidA